jgi:hypothetical protein
MGVATVRNNGCNIVNTDIAAAWCKQSAQSEAVRQKCLQLTVAGALVCMVKELDPSQLAPEDKTKGPELRALVRDVTEGVCTDLRRWAKQAQCIDTAISIALKEFRQDRQFDGVRAQLGLAIASLQIGGSDSVAEMKQWLPAGDMGASSSPDDATVSRAALRVFMDWCDESFIEDCAADIRVLEELGQAGLLSADMARRVARLGYALSLESLLPGHDSDKRVLQMLHSMLAKEKICNLVTAQMSGIAMRLSLDHCICDPDLPYLVELYTSDGGGHHELMFADVLEHRNGLQLYPRGLTSIHKNTMSDSIGLSARHEVWRWMSSSKRDVPRAPTGSGSSGPSRASAEDELRRANALRELRDELARAKSALADTQKQLEAANKRANNLQSEVSSLKKKMTASAQSAAPAPDGNRDQRSVGSNAASPTAPASLVPSVSAVHSSSLRSDAPSSASATASASATSSSVPPPTASAGDSGGQRSMPPSASSQASALSSVSTVVVQKAARALSGPRAGRFTVNRSFTSENALSAAHCAHGGAPSRSWGSDEESDHERRGSDTDGSDCDSRTRRRGDGLLKKVQSMLDQQARQNAEHLKMMTALFDRAAGQAPAPPVAPAARPSSYSAAAGAKSSAAPCPANQPASASVAAASSAASEEDKARQYGIDHARDWSSDKAFALGETCAHAVRRGASSASVKMRLRFGYCLFDECRKSDCQRCKAGKCGRKCVAREEAPSAVLVGTAASKPRSGTN